MIVRISTEGQYELTENDVEALGEMDNQAVAACEADDEQLFRDVFERMVEFVRSNGHPLDHEKLAPSDLILPPPDVSMDEAKGAFEGEGLIPG